MRLIALGLFLCLGLLTTAVPLSAQIAVTAAGSSGDGNPFSPPAAQIYSYFDHTGVSATSESLREFLTLNQSLPGSVTPAALSSAVALRNLRGMLAGERNQAFMQAASAARELGSATALGAAAMVYIARGRSAEALALLVVADEKAPADPSSRLNLAAAALAFRKANEALPLLDDVEKSGAVPMGAMGIPGDIVIAYLRGYAFMLRGEYQAAKPLLVRVVEAEPNLKEAALTLALVQARLRENPRKSYLLGVWRQRGKLLVLDRKTPGTEAEATREPDPFTEGEDIFPSMDDLLDVSKGQPGVLMEVTRPATALELMAVSETYVEAMLASLEAAAEQHNVAGGAHQAFRDSQQPAAYKRRMSNLYDKATIRYGAVASLDQAARQTDFFGEQLRKRTEEAIDAAMAAREPIMARWIEIASRPGHPTDAEQRQWYAELNATTDQALASVGRLLQSYHGALDREFNIRSAYMNGMLAHIGDPRLRTALAAEAEAVRHEMEADKLAAVINLLSAIGAFEETAPNAAKRGKDGQGPQCDDNDGKASVSVDAVLVEVEFTCTSVSLELNASIVPLVGVSAELGVDVSGTVSAFIGPKVDAKVWSYKDGIFVTAGKEGLRGAGFKGEMKGSTGFGPVKINQKIDETAVTFLPAPDPGPPPGPLPIFQNR